MSVLRIVSYYIFQCYDTISISLFKPEIYHWLCTDSLKFLMTIITTFFKAQS